MIEDRLRKIFLEENPGLLPDEIDDKVHECMKCLPYIRLALFEK